MKKLPLLFILILANCAKGYKPIVGPDGKTHYSIECSSLEDGKAKAEKICSNGYNITASTGTLFEPQTSEYLPKNTGQAVDTLLLGPFAPNFSSNKSVLQVRCK